MGRTDNMRPTIVRGLADPAAISRALLTTGRATAHPGYGVESVNTSALTDIPANPHTASTSNTHAELTRMMNGPSTATSAPRASSQARVSGEKYAHVAF